MKHESVDWMNSLAESISSYRRMIDAAVEQLTDEELNCRPSPDTNSVAVLLRHLGGNLKSRWTDCFLTDGEKPDRDRDAEFRDWDGDRESLLAYFDMGWQCLTSTIQQVSVEDLSRSIMIRGEAHTVPEAFLRSLAHIAYHAGQITMTARRVHEGEWQWLTIAPGESQRHNQRTWGSKASRAVLRRSNGESERDV